MFLNMKFFYKLKINEMKKILFFIVAVTLSFSAISQHMHPNDEKGREKFKAEKISFLTSSIDLTPAEAEKFWPLYNQLEKERWEAQMQRWQLEEKLLETRETNPDKKIKQFTREYAGSMQKEANLLVSYNEKFLEILPPAKVLRLYKAENEFRFHMIRKFRDKKRNSD